jgi:hypothetical protein
MNYARLLLVLLLWSVPATAGEQSKIDRTIAKEPKYQSKPKYCLLVFGSDARTKVWLVLDRDVLYVDRNGNGDLTGEDKKVRRGKAHGEAPGNFACGDIVQAGGKTICRDLWVSGSPEEGDMWITANPDGKHSQSAGYDADGFLKFADSPAHAPLIHFDGPLTTALVPLPEISRTFTSVKKGDKNEVLVTTAVRVILPELKRGKESAELKVAVGTVGQGKGTFARIHHKGLAAGIHPLAKLEYPNRDPAKGTIKFTLALRNRC